jgi:hypothetical protein
MELRDKIAEIIIAAYEQTTPGDGADAILALPEIKEALALRKLREASPTRAPIPVLSPMEAVRRGSTID